MTEDSNRSHSLRYSDHINAIEAIKQRIKEKNKRCNFSYDQLCQILDSMASFPLGRHILNTSGANGIWTDYMISFPWSEENLPGKMLSMNRLEYFIIFEMPSVLAQRELFLFSKKIAQKFACANKTLASIPCGVMRDLLELQINPTENVTFVGIDLDTDAIEAAKNLARKKCIKNVRFEKKDAWNLGIYSEFDFITSIGLNCYVPDQEQVIDLYTNIYKALKPGGSFFTGVLTYPPYFGKHSDWNLSAIPEYHVQMDVILTRDILDLKFQNYRTLNEIEYDFKKAGFSNISVFPDSRRIFPAVVATKD